MDRKIVYVGIDTLFQALPALVKAGCRVCEIVSCPVDNETEFNLRTCAFAGDNQIPLLIGRIMREMWNDGRGQESMRLSAADIITVFLWMKSCPW